MTVWYQVVRGPPTDDETSNRHVVLYVLPVLTVGPVRKKTYSLPSFDQALSAAALPARCKVPLEETDHSELPTFPRLSGSHSGGPCPGTWRPSLPSARATHTEPEPSS